MEQCPWAPDTWLNQVLVITKEIKKLARNTGATVINSAWFQITIFLTHVVICTDLKIKWPRHTRMPSRKSSRNHSDYGASLSRRLVDVTVRDGVSVSTQVNLVSTINDQGQVFLLCDDFYFFAPLNYLDTRNTHNNPLHTRSYPVHGAYAYPIVPGGYGSSSSGYGSYNPYGTMSSRANFDPYRRWVDISKQLPSSVIISSPN